ncbi:monocopper oxidase-like protein SKS1 [Panicum miliaceum]|uniref:Monocopper oxidase-like protein SKS1 n=1 Tax=Panicum miliaceum TaxID=4540 RepID=A0A3L6QEC5_PANMI|nr:monocopper oxidase-like protein SKS1 [Panicum miliaceum]
MGCSRAAEGGCGVRCLEQAGCSRRRGPTADGGWRGAVTGGAVVGGCGEQEGAAWQNRKTGGEEAKGEGKGHAAIFIAAARASDGRTYRLRVSNVGTRTSLSFRIQGHKLLLVEAEGTYTLQKHYASLDVHPGQSLSVLVTADQLPKPSYYMVVSSLFVEPELFGVANVLYAGSGGLQPPGAAPLENLSSHNGYNRSMEQARTVRMNLTCGAARPNPQGSFRYGRINMSRTLLLLNDEAEIGGRRRCTVNGVSFAGAATPLKLADHFDVAGVFTVVSGRPERRRQPSLGTAVIDARYRDFVQIVFENRVPSLQTWHLDGYNFFVAGMGWGKWSPDARSTYNLVDAIYRSTVQVYPSAWTAVLVSLDNEGMWNLRSQSLDRRYLGQEIYMRVSQGSSEVPDPRDELPMPPNALLCGKAKSSKIGRA